ncbi:MAG: hypothetical protein BHW05_04575 [Clostridium sp. 42_12]|nr:MAG: hypothetical protein BHW05_04575 [Clostridium sp. 42_12]
MLINTGNISRKVLSKVLRSFVKNFERLQCKYKGTNVIIYYRMKKRGWKRLPLTSSSIRKNRRRFRIRCSSRRQTYYFRVKTYRKVRGKKVKSVYSNVAKVSIR